MDEKTAVDEVTSTQKSLSSCHEPGWNDPPKWALTPTQGSATTKTPTKRLLNRRVAFPLSSSTAVQNSNADQPQPSFPGNFPPPLVQSTCLTSAPHAPLLAPSGIESQPSEVRIDKDRALSETLKNLEDVISKELDSSSKMEEVRRRLDAMKIMWKDDKLKDGVCEKVLEISKALRNNDVEGADKIHISLMMEYAAICNTWISGIRHMILELREKSSQASSVSTIEGFHPYLLPQPMNPNENT